MNVGGDAGFLLELSGKRFTQFKENLIELYLHAFTQGDYAQLISADEAVERLENLQQTGHGWIYILNTKPVALLFWQPLLLDNDFPEIEIPEVDLQSAAYIAEVVVHDAFRGRGIATLMIETALREISKSYTQTVIRVWDQNLPAVLLYRKLGFREKGTIVQTKHFTSGKQFEMLKLYMLKEHEENHENHASQ